LNNYEFAYNCESVAHNILPDFGVSEELRK